MMKWIVGLLVIANVVFFAILQWGATLAIDPNKLATQAPLNADKIKLMGEGSVPASAPSVLVASAELSSLPAASHVAEMQTAPPKLSCMEWGEFSGADLQRAEKDLAALDLGNKLKQHVVEYGSGYWVYIAPLKTRALAEQKVAQLKTRGVADYFIVQEAGPWQNAISLGVFKTGEAANKYLAKLQELGVKSAMVGERASKLKFTVFELDHLDGALSARLAILHKDYPESDLKLVSCN